MTAGWVAGTIRSRAMARRVLGADAARELASCRSLPEAQRKLATTPFRGAAEPGLSLAAAQHAIAATILWDMRVLAGWLPHDGVSLLRLLAGWFEIANVDELLQAFTGRPSGAQFQLGALATAWSRLSEARTTAQLRRALTASVWGDPGGDTSGDIRFGMRARWAARVAGSGDRARAWATTAQALLHATEPAGASTAAGAGAQVTSLRPRSGRPGRPDPAQPPAVPVMQAWRGEADWWRRVEREGRVLLRSSATDSGPVLGAIVVMAADGRRVRAALASAARGGIALETYDALV